MIKEEGIPNTHPQHGISDNSSHVRTRDYRHLLNLWKGVPYERKTDIKAICQKRSPMNILEEAFHAHELGKLIGYYNSHISRRTLVAHGHIPIYREHAVANLTAKKRR
jgi:hypothetical protein